MTQTDVNLAEQVVGILSVPHGGTGATSLSGILKGAGSSIATAVQGTDYLVPGSALGTPASGNLSKCTVPGMIPWCPEANICQGTLATGLNDLPGGFAVEPGINASGVTLQSVWVRLGTTSATFANQSVFDFYIGTATSLGSSIVISVTMAASSNNQIAALGTPVSMGANSVVRINCSTAGASVSGPIHVQLRGVYNG